MTTAPYPTFDRDLFTNINEALAWENLQHELYRNSGHYVLHFSRDITTGHLSFEIAGDGRYAPDGQVLVTGDANLETGVLRVLVFDDKRCISWNKFETWDHPLVFGAAVAFVLRAAER